MASRPSPESQLKEMQGQEAEYRAQVADRGQQQQQQGQQGQQLGPQPGDEALAVLEQQQAQRTTRAAAPDRRYGSTESLPEVGCAGWRCRVGGQCLTIPAPVPWLAKCCIGIITAAGGDRRRAARLVGPPRVAGSGWQRREVPRKVAGEAVGSGTPTG